MPREPVGGAANLNESRFYLRNPRSVAVSGDGIVWLIPEAGDVIEQRTADVQAWSRLLQRLAVAVSGAALNNVRDLPGDLDETLFDRLVDAKLIFSASRPETLDTARQQVFTHNAGFEFARAEQLVDNLVFACCGSIVAGLVAPTVLSLFYSRLQSRLEVILTEAARRFVTADLFEYYGIRTWTDAFERRDDYQVPHVQLGSAAQCILVLPATAGALQRLACAACSDLLSLTVAASRCPLIVAPVMNAAMWNHPAVQRNLARLRADGAYVIEPTIIFGAADFVANDEPMYGGHGTFWSGPRGLLRVITVAVRHHAGQTTADN